MTFFKKIKNNKGADLQLLTVVLLLIFLLAIFMAMDFWMASSAKIILMKEIQSAEVYSLVKTVEGNYAELQMIKDPLTADMITYQSSAIERYGRQGGTDENPLAGELYSRLKRVQYLNSYEVNTITGVSPAVGQMGIYTKLTYNTKTLIRSPQEIIGWITAKRGDIKTTANKDITLTVTAKVVPVIWDTGGPRK